MQQEGENYFSNQSKEENKEENPIIVEPESAIRYYNLEKVFNTFFQREVYLLQKKNQQQSVILNILTILLSLTGK